ncbi:MAG: sigma 54-interacting transcriptional regulator [Deltaproteobacteria bacterium]|nr:sigma 54-interacting transcriptional regulator [Deltaproteobacteria bacterium]
MDARALQEMPVDLDEDVLSTAALFEGDFSIDWLQEISDLKISQILAALEAGVENDILTKQQPGQFCFKKDPIRKKYKDRLTADKKSELNRLVTAILMREADADDSSLELVAKQLLHTVNDEKGCRWLVRAADHYRSIYRYETALQCYVATIRVLRGIRGKAADDLLIQAAIGYSKISEAGADTRDVASALGEAIKRAERSAGKAQIALLELNLAKTKWMAWEENRAFFHFNRGWALAKEVNEPGLMRSATNFSTFFLYWQGRFREVVRNYEKYLPEVEKYPRGKFPMMAAWVVGSAYASIGQVTQGMGMMDAVYNHSRNSGDAFGAITTGIGIGMLLFEMGRIDESIEYLKDAKAHSRHAPNQLFLISRLGYLAITYLQKGDRKQAEQYLSKFLHASRRLKMTRNYFPPLMELCWAIEQGRLSRIGGLSLEKEVQRSVRSKNVYLKGAAYQFKARLLVHRGESHEKILRALMLSVKWLEESGNQRTLAYTKLELARLHLSMGNEKKAQDVLKSIAGRLENIPPSDIPQDLRFLIKDLRPDRNLLREIMKLTTELVTIRDFRKAARTIISTANQITGAERGAIFQVADDSSARNLTLMAAKNLAADDIERPDFTQSMKMIRKTAQTGEGRIHMIRPGKATATSVRQVIRSCICVPMKIAGRVVGVLYHDNRFFSSAFTKADLEIFNYFAALSAIAVDNSRAYEEIKELNRKLQNEKEYYQEQQLESHHFEEFIGKSPAIKRVVSEVNQVAGTDANVLILGETGVGKELVARAIHKRSPRKDKPFIRVNCSALPESLIASELFGHEKGAFTGATNRRIGRFELANTGTLFLDEIGDIPLEVQVRLLRVLQSKEFERVGGKETLRSDFRLVTATNRNLKNAVRERKFREDLYYRLNVFPIQVPPLRSRQMDVPLLVQYFLKIHSTKTGKDIKHVSEADMEKLLRYHWPGNVRELENVVERGTILSSGAKFRMPELQDADPVGDVRGKAVTFEENERRHLVWALAETGGKIRGKGGAAELLDLHPSTIYFKVKKLGIEKP